MIFSLSRRLFLMIAVAALLPLAILGIASFISVQAVALDNLEAFIDESGSRRQEAIENDLRTALNLLNDFANANQAELAITLEQQITGNVSDLDARHNEIKTLFRSELLPDGYFNSLSLMTTRFCPFATVAIGGNLQTDTPICPRPGEETEIGQIASRLSLTNTQVFAITNRNTIAHLEVINAIITINENDEPEIVGYLLADLNLNTVIIENLRQTQAQGGYNTYAYLILPDINAALAPEDTIAENLIDDSSTGAERAKLGEVGVLSYEVGEEGALRSVVGHSTTIEINNKRFALITEVNTSLINEQIFNQGLPRIFPFTVGGLAISVIVALFAGRGIVSSLRRLRGAILALTVGDFEHPVSDVVNRGDEIGSIATSFVDMRETIREQTEDMNRRLRERTRDVQVTQDIGRAVTAERDLERLLNRVVNLIVQNFSTIYHAQIFLLDEDKQMAVLRASTGQAGRELLSRGHKLGVGSVSVIGQVTEQGQVIIARDTAESTVHRQNEFLGDTRAELAIPLRLGNEIIGALDVQSKQRDSFDEDQVAALQTLADQITIAIENARLYAESARLLANIEQERGANAREAWKQLLYQQRKDNLVIQSGVNTGYEFEKLRQAVLLGGKSVVSEVTSRNTIPFAVPIILRGQTLGIVEYELPQTEFNYDKVLLAEELVARLAISLENARLFQNSQDAAERERVVNEISTKLTGQTDIEAILQLAIKEVGQALRTPQVAIRLQTNNPENGNHQTEAESLL